MINSKSAENAENELKATGNPFMQWRARNIGLFVFVIAILSSTLTNMDQSLFSYVLPDIMGTFAFSLNDTGSIISVSFLAAMIIAPIAGILADRWSQRWMLLTCMGLSAILVGLQGLATSQQGFIILRALSFGLSAALVPIIASMVANYSSDKNRTWFISLLQCGYPLGWFFASLVVALLLDNGWRIIFMMGFIVAPLVLLFAMSLPSNPKVSAIDTSAGNKGSIAEIFSGSFRFTALAFCAAFFCYGLASGAKIFYLPTFFQVARGYSGEMAALIMGTLQVVGIIGYLLSAYISRRYLSLRTTTLMFATLGAITLVIAIWLPQSQWQDLIVFSIMAIFVNGTASIAIVFLMNQSHPKLRGSTMGICGSACVNAGFLVSPLVTTRLVEFMGWHWMYTIFVGSGLIASGLFFFLAGKHKVNHEITTPAETLAAEYAS